MTTLSITQEIFLLFQHAAQQNAKLPGEKVTGLILSAGILMDLTINNIIDADFEGQIIPDTKTRLASGTLNEFAGIIHGEKDQKDVIYWLSEIYKKLPAIKSGLTEQLITAGFASQKKGGFGVFSSKKTIKADEDKATEIQQRLKDVLQSEEIPEFHDIALISLLYHGEMMSFVLSDTEMEKHQERLQDIAHLELIGQSISEAVDDITLMLVINEKKGVFQSKTPLEEFKEMIEATRTKFRIKDNSRLPSWMREGTPQYKEALKFIASEGTGMIIYNQHTKQFMNRKYSSSAHIFGSGS